MRVRRRERRAGKGGQLRKSAQKRSSHSCSDPGWEGKFSSAGGEKKKTYKKQLLFFPFFQFIYLGEDIRRLLGEERQEEERGIRELLQPPSVLLQGKMDSDSGEQSDGDLSPGKTQDHSWKNNVRL